MTPWFWHLRCSFVRTLQLDCLPSMVDLQPNPLIGWKWSCSKLRESIRLRYFGYAYLWNKDPEIKLLTSRKRNLRCSKYKNIPEIKGPEIKGLEDIFQIRRFRKITNLDLEPQFKFQVNVSEVKGLDAKLLEGMDSDVKLRIRSVWVQRSQSFMVYIKRLIVYVLMMVWNVGV